MEGFTCKSCGKWHDGVPLDFGYDAPQYWSHDLESDPNSFHNSDFCVIGKDHFFIRGLIEIPIIGRTEAFHFGVWVSLSESNFSCMVGLWEDPAIVNEPAHFGWLSNSIDLYPETLNLKTNVKSRTVRMRPYIELEPTDHPLSLEQRNGISWNRVIEIAEMTMHWQR